MSNRPEQTRAALLAGALPVPLGVAACSSSTKTSAVSAGTTANPTGSAATSSAAGDAMAKPFGAACPAVPTSGAGSFDGMSTAPVVSAASANPVLSTLVTAVKAAGLVDTLNTRKAITVFAPADSAFATVPAASLQGLLADKAALTDVLTYHVLAGKIAPDRLAGDHRTLEGATVTVAGSSENFTVGSGKANVVCGNVQTANATVYILDSVLMPPAK